jgi:hypothetical protein
MLLKIFSYFFFLTISIICSNGFAQSQEEIKLKIYNYLQLHSPSSFSLVNEINSMPQNISFSKDDRTIQTKKNVTESMYLQLEDIMMALHSCNILTHEYCHFMNTILGMEYQLSNSTSQTTGLNWDGYYISPFQTYFISYDKKKIFASSKLIKVIPDSLKTFRFSPYIDGNIGTQQNGIFGLLNEYCAYLFGTKCTFELYPAYCENKRLGYVDWDMDMQGTMDAYYEFEFFIKEYLLYAYNYNRESYNYLKSLSNFKEVYLQIHSEFQNLNTLYLKKRKELIVKYSKEKNQLLKMSKNDSEIKNKLIPIFNSDRYARISSDFGF